MDPQTRKAIQEFDIPNPFKCGPVVDFCLCVGLEELKETIHNINLSGYIFLTATQDGETYTVFFRRPSV